MTSPNFSDFLTPSPGSPLVTVTNQLIVFLSSAFWGPPTPSAYVINGSPLNAALNLLLFMRLEVKQLNVCALYLKD